MKSKTFEVDLSYGWGSISWILSRPEKTLPFFPYFKELRGNKVRFEVPRFVFNFGYEFTLDYSIQENKAIYTFRGEKGILTITFEMDENKLKITASWSGFGEILMGKPLENFTRGIGTAIAEFCSAAKCPIQAREETVENLTPDLLVALIKRAVLEVGRNFRLEGQSEEGSYFSIIVSDGVLRELKIKKESRESIVKAEVPVTSLDGDLFSDVPTNMRFRIKISGI